MHTINAILSWCPAGNITTTYVYRFRKIRLIIVLTQFLLCTLKFNSIIP